MERRDFLAYSLTSSALAAGAALPTEGAQAAPKGDLFIQIRRYSFEPVGNMKVMDDFLRDALIPASNRLGIAPVGVFNSWFGPDSLSGKWVLLVGPSVETLATLDLRLADDAEFMKAGAPFLAAPIKDPAFSHLETSLLKTMPRLPGVSVPAELAKSPKRIFELRTYVQPTDASHQLKVALFQDGGEAESLKRAGFHAVFHAVNLVGSGMPGSSLPSLTYMWVYESLAARQEAEDVWMASPDMHTVMSNPKYAATSNVISNVIMKPTSYSQL